MQDGIDYRDLMHDAMRGLIATVLSDVAVNGLPGDHHFFIAFDTRHKDVGLSDALKARFPEEMTIVIQHEYYDLTVTETGFSVTLSFGDVPENLVVPFSAVKTFVDPSVEFGLRFEPEIEDVDETPEPPQPDARPNTSDVVQLDSFRKS